MQRYRRDPIWLIVVLGAFQILMLRGAAVTHRARREEGTLPAACFSADCAPPFQQMSGFYLSQPRCAACHRHAAEGSVPA